MRYPSRISCIHWFCGINVGNPPTHHVQGNRYIAFIQIWKRPLVVRSSSQPTAQCGVVPRTRKSKSCIADQPACIHHYIQVYLYIYLHIYIHVQWCRWVCSHVVFAHVQFFLVIHNLHTFSDVVGLLGLATRDSQDEDTHKAPLMEDVHTYRLCYIHFMYAFFSWRWPILSWRWIIKSFITWSLKNTRQAGQVSFRNGATTQLQENQIQIGAPQLSQDAIHIYIYRLVKQGFYNNNDPSNQR